MKLSRDLTSLSREELLVLVAQLERQVAQLSARLEALQAENAQLQRSTKRQAAPFAKGTRESKPKRPGRKPGEGTFSFRQAPRPEEITESPVNVLGCVDISYLLIWRYETSRATPRPVEENAPFSTLLP